MPINVRTIVSKTGPVFTYAARGLVDAQVDSGAQAAQAHLVRAIKAKTPVRTGELQRSIVARGQGLKRSVVADRWRAIPLDSGWLPASTRARIALVRNTYKLRGKRKLLRALKASKVPGKQFFYRTFDQVQPLLASQYLAPVGAGIIKALGGEP